MTSHEPAPTDLALFFRLVRFGQTEFHDDVQHDLVRLAILNHHADLYGSSREYFRRGEDRDEKWPPRFPGAHNAPVGLRQTRNKAKSYEKEQTDLFHWSIAGIIMPRNCIG